MDTPESFFALTQPLVNSDDTPEPIDAFDRVALLTFT